MNLPIKTLGGTWERRTELTKNILSITLKICGRNLIVNSLIVFINTVRWVAETKYNYKLKNKNII